MKQPHSDGGRLAEITQVGVGKTLVLAAILFPLFAPADAIVSPANFRRFVIYRFATALVLVAFFFLNRLRRSIPYQYLITLAATALSATTIELVVLKSGGQESSYYVGMILVAVCALGFVPIRLSFGFVLVAVIDAIYLVPLMLTEREISAVFVNNNVFLLSAFVIALLLRYQNQKLILKELRLSDELSKDKQMLERYSNSLQGEVTEKTGALAVTEQKYRALFDNANDGIAVLDGKGNITDVNFRFCELHGFSREALIGTNYRLLQIGVCTEDINDRLKRILDGDSLVYEAEHYRKDGSRIVLEISSRAIDIGGVPHIQSFHRDITEKRRLQEQVLQSQKMESMGVLAGGIAHDFNNILTAILGHTEVLRRHVESDEFTTRRIKTVEDAARRAGQMVSKLLSFARKESLELVPTDLNGVIMDTMELLGRALIDRNVRPQLALDQDIPTINGDSIHLEQVIANLALNAVDAMPEGGTITISSSRIELGPDAPHVHPLLKPGNYAVLSVSDSGTGIPCEIMDRIFDPFFTTKPAGKGTGLGLAMVYGIVKSHKGEIRVESTVGAGTIFTIYLPLPEKPATHHTKGNLSFHPAATAGGILVVDDEKDVLSSIKETLDPEGYKVFLADNAEYARDLFHQISRDIDLVITDIVMPLMNGVELARALKEMRPAIKVIGISAYDGVALVEEGRYIDFFIKKPFDGSSLLTTMRRVLDVVE